MSILLLLAILLGWASSAEAESRHLQLTDVVHTLANQPTGQPPVWAPLPKGDDLFGPGVLTYSIRGDETLLQVGRSFDLGYNSIVLANPKIDPWLPPSGTLIRVPLLHIYPEGRDSRPELVINRPEMRLYFHRKDGWIETYPLGVGREGYDTPLTETKVTRKMAKPTWYVPESVRREDPKMPAVVPPGPENPLGTHAIYLSIPSYLIHGTNRPFGVGRRVSRGCMRLYPEDIVRLFRRVEPGLRVRIVDQPAKAGWRGDQLYLEAHPTLKKKDRGQLPGKAAEAINKAIKRRHGQSVHVDWALVGKMTRAADGIPRVVGHASQDALRMVDNRPKVMPASATTGHKAKPAQKATKKKGD
ncbi:MAG: L,D-transpeptidase family protein [Magnetococcales bacterium]|nr:L,D-transpeptidase family protein [Magnetococcales bacterium]MBF0322232.1 L,D-transpeptidase family protein [Magnetococcales bacterium]